MGYVRVRLRVRLPVEHVKHQLGDLAMYLGEHSAFEPASLDNAAKGLRT